MKTGLGVSAYQEDPAARKKTDRILVCKFVNPGVFSRDRIKIKTQRLQQSFKKTGGWQ
jgi:hypothetical protein